MLLALVYYMAQASKLLTTYRWYARVCVSNSFENGVIRTFMWWVPCCESPESIRMQKSESKAKNAWAENDARK